MPSKDQRSIDEEPTSYEKWDRAKTLLLESLHKPDHHLRSFLGYVNRLIY